MRIPSCPSYIPNFPNCGTEFTDAALQEPVNEAHSQWFFTCNFIFSRKDTYMTHSPPHKTPEVPSSVPDPTLFHDRRTVSAAHHGNSSGTLDANQGAGLSDHGLFSDRRHRNFLYQCRTADTFMYLDHLFPRYGDGRTYDHIQLPDVRLLPVRKEPLKYLGDPVWCVPLLPLP